MKERIDRFYTRAKSAVEQVLATDAERPHGLTQKELWNWMWGSPSKYERLLATLRLVKDVLPKSLTGVDPQAVRDLLYFKSYLPFDPEKYSFEKTVGIGGVARVYLLESRVRASPSWVVKVFRPDLFDLPPEGQLQRLRLEYKNLQGIYSEIPDLIPREHFFVLHDPYRKGRAAAALLQPFESGIISDLFSLASAERRSLFLKFPDFKQTVAAFAGRTLGYLAESGEVVDLLGENNVAVVWREDEGPRLRLLDPSFLGKKLGKADRTRLQGVLAKLTEIRAEASIGGQE